jgi:hypothetical protein
MILSVMPDQFGQLLIVYSAYCGFTEPIPDHLPEKRLKKRPLSWKIHNASVQHSYRVELVTDYECAGS